MPLTIFAKRSIFDVWLGSYYASELYSTAKYETSKKLEAQSKEKISL